MGADRPKYNEWTVIREITVAGFASDADWIANQDKLLLDGGGVPTRAFQVPNLPGRPASGFALLLMGVDAAGAPIAPGAGTADIDLVELVRYSGQWDDDAAHIAAVEDPTTALTAYSIALPAGVVARVPNVGGAQNLFAARVTALTGSVGATKMRLLMRPLGGA